MRIQRLIGLLAGFALAGMVFAAPPDAAMLFTTGVSEVAVPAQAAGTQAQEQTFEGKIMKKQGQYVFEDSTGKSYMLDNQEKAKQFEGKKVKVKGTLTVVTNTIRVSNIELDES